MTERTRHQAINNETGHNIEFDALKWKDIQHSDTLPSAVHAGQYIYDVANPVITDKDGNTLDPLEFDVGVFLSDMRFVFNHLPLGLGVTSPPR